jgi:hypothetical protein
MRKLTGIFLAVLIGSGMSMPSFAAQRGTPEYQKLVEYKRMKRQEKEKRAQGVMPPAEKTFWQKEAERSGFAGTGRMFAGALGNAIPLDKPNSGKKSSAANPS